MVCFGWPLLTFNGDQNHLPVGKRERYTNIAAMVKVGVSLVKGLAAAREMFEGSFQPSESLKAMIYFEGGDLHLLTPETKETLVKAVSGIRKLPQIELVARTLGPTEVNFKQRGETPPPLWPSPMN